MSKHLFIPLNDVPNADDLLGLTEEQVTESRIVDVEPVTEPAHKPIPTTKPDQHSGPMPTGRQSDFVWGFLFFDIPEIYRDGNKVYFHGEVTKESINGVKREIMRAAEHITNTLSKLGIYDPNEAYIELIIHSPGGCVYSGFNLIDFIESFSIPIITTGTGTVASMAALILLAGKKRRLTKNAHILIHQIRSIIGGKRDDIMDYIKHLEDIQKQFIKYISERTKLSKTEIEQLLKRESWIMAEEALKMGLIDEII